MYDNLLEKVKKVKPNALSDEEILGFFEEAISKACPDKNDYSSGEYIDDVLFFYALAMVSLFGGDLADYSNYYMLYNNAAAEYSRRSFQPGESKKTYTNLW